MAHVQITVCPFSRALYFTQIMPQNYHMATILDLATTNIRHSLNRLIKRRPRLHCQFLFLHNNYIDLFFMRHSVVYYSMINRSIILV